MTLLNAWLTSGQIPEATQHDPDRFLRWSNLSDAHAGTITITGICTVFTGLAILYLFMVLLNWIFKRTSILNGEQSAGAAAAEPVSTSAEDEPALEAASTPRTMGREPYQNGEPLPPGWSLPKDPARVALAAVSAALLATHLFDHRRLNLGEECSLKVEGKPHRVSLLSVGHVNRAMVDGEEIAFFRSRVAANDATGQAIQPARSA